MEDIAERQGEALITGHYSVLPIASEATPLDIRKLTIFLAPNRSNKNVLV